MDYGDELIAKLRRFKQEVDDRPLADLGESQWFYHLAGILFVQASDTVIAEALAKADAAIGYMHGRQQA